MELHAIALAVGGGTGGIRSQQQLASALAQPEQSAFGEDLHQTIPEKAAAYGYFIAAGQPFLNGNKRTALLAMETFLERMAMNLSKTTIRSLTCSTRLARRRSINPGFSDGSATMPGPVGDPNHRLLD